MNRLSWIFIGSTVAVIALIGFFLYRPMVTSGIKTYKDNLSLEKENTEFAKKEKTLIELDKNNQLKTLYDTASQYIPDDANSGPLILELSAIAEESKMGVNQISLEADKAATRTPDEADATTTETNSTTKTNTTPSTSSSALAEIGFSMTVSGTFNDFMTFLKKVETSSRLISLTTMSMTNQESFTVQLSGKAFWKKQTSLAKNVSNITLSEEVINKFKNLKTYSIPINLPTESGFGRDNPFEGL